MFWRTTSSCVLVTGGILGMTGAMMQGVTRNPIAEPSLLGISQGATLFVALLYASGIGATAGNTLLAALLGAFFSGVPVLIFTMKNPGNLSVTKLLLAGTAMSTFFTALTSVAGLLSNQSQMVGFWVSGGFRGATWLDVKIILAAGIPGFLAAVLLAGASTGGMDIPPLVLNHYFKIPVSVSMYVFDFCILLAQAVGNPPEKVLYGLILVMTYTLVLDKLMLMGTTRTEVRVISERAQEIREAILAEMDRGVTMLSGETGYLKQETQMIFSVISNREVALWV